MAELASEILRIVSTPYAVSLKDLDSILKSTPSSDLRKWSNTHPCRVKALAGAILVALEFCPYALSVVEGLGRVEAVRDAMLAERKTLLDDLLRSAKQNENSFEKYSPACLSLLSLPLPAETPPPALLVPFFLRCVELATKSPSPDTIRAIYNLVSNGHNHFVELLTSSQILALCDRLAGFLTISDHSVLLLALATLARLDPILDSLDISSGRNSPGDINRQKQRGPKEFFHGSKAPKVLQLVSNIVIDLASRDSGWEIAVDHIKLAVAVVDAVENSIKQESPLTVYAKKLLEKAKKPGLDLRVFSEILEFSIAINPKDSPLPGLTELIERISLKSYQDEVHGRGTIFLPISIAQSFANNISKDLVGNILKSTLALTLSTLPPTLTSRSNLRDRVKFIKALSEQIPESEKLTSGLLSPLVTNEFSTLLEEFVRPQEIQLSNSACEISEVCPTDILTSQRELSSIVCKLLLRAGMYSGANEEVWLDPSFACLLLEKQSRLAAGTIPCCPSKYSISSHAVTNNVLSLFEASATPETRLDSRNWQKNLSDELARDAHRQHQSIVAAMGKICRDLETRCEGIERPLREEMEKSARLRAEVEDMKNRCSELEDEVERRGTAIENVEEQKEKLEKLLDEEVSRGKKSVDIIAELENEIRGFQDEVLRTRGELKESTDKLVSAHEAELQESRSLADKVALEHTAALGDRQRVIEELEEVQSRLEQQVHQLEEDLKNKNEVDDQKITWLSKELSDLDADLEVQKATVARKDEEIEKLEQALEDAEDEEKELRMEIESLEMANRQLSENHIEEEKASRKRIENLETVNETLKGENIELEKEIAKAVDSNRRAREKLDADHSNALMRLRMAHEEDMQMLQMRLQETRAEWLKERDAQSAENRSLTKKMNKLHAYQEQKAKEAENIARQLVGAMSNPGDLAAFLRSGENEQPCKTPGPAQAPASLNEAPPPAATHMGRRRLNHDMSFESDPSPRIPKRIKRQAPKTPHKTQQRVGFKSVVKSPHTSRKSVEPVGKEHQISDSIAKDDELDDTVELDNEMDDCYDTEVETNYGEADMFTSTPKLRISGGGGGGGGGDGGRRVSEGIGAEYDTTADF